MTFWVRIVSSLILSALVLSAQQPDVVVTPLGPEINGIGAADQPVLSADGRTMYFYKIGSINNLDNMWGSRFKEGKWIKAVNLKIETPFDEAVMAVSADGNKLILSAIGYKPFVGLWDLYYRVRTSAGWSEAKMFARPINSKEWDGQAAFSPDGETIIFCSSRSGGFGANDIYACFSLSNGWSNPVNLGSIVNTEGYEVSPFIHADGRTMYFSSTGHANNIGGFDVYKCSRLDDSWTNWSEPVNLGSKINSKANEIGYNVPISGDIAYYAKDGVIYTVTLPREARVEKPVIGISGKVTDDRGNPLEVEIRYEELAGSSNRGRLKSSPIDGTYFIALTAGFVYGWFAEKSNYFPESKNIDLTAVSNRFDLTMDIVMQKMAEVKQGRSIVINNVFFSYDSANLSSASYPELKRLARLILTESDAHVEISGHTDYAGEAFYNRQLSYRRALSVAEYLISQGVPKERLTPKGYGSSRPLVKGTDPKSMAQNRRVEFRFIF